MTPENHPSSSEEPHNRNGDKNPNFRVLGFWVESIDRSNERSDRRIRSISGENMQRLSLISGLVKLERTLHRRPAAVWRQLGPRSFSTETDDQASPIDPFLRPPPTGFFFSFSLLFKQVLWFLDIFLSWLIYFFLWW